MFDSFSDVPHTAFVDYLGSQDLNYKDERIQNCHEVASSHFCITVLKVLSDKFEFKTSYY